MRTPRHASPGLEAFRAGQRLEVVGDFRCHEPAVLIPPLVGLPFDVEDDPAGLRITIRRAVTTDGRRIGAVVLLARTQGPAAFDGVQGPRAKRSIPRTHRGLRRSASLMDRFPYERCRASGIDCSAPRCEKRQGKRRSRGGGTHRMIDVHVHVTNSKLPGLIAEDPRLDGPEPPLAALLKGEMAKAGLDPDPGDGPARSSEVRPAWDRRHPPPRRGSSPASTRSARSTRPEPGPTTSGPSRRP